MTSNAASTESNAADAKWRMLRMRKGDSKVLTEAAEASDSPLWTMDCEKDGRMDGRTERQTDGRTDGRTERQTDRDRQRKTDGRKDGETDRRRKKGKESKRRRMMA